MDIVIWLKILQCSGNNNDGNLSLKEDILVETVQLFSSTCSSLLLKMFCQEERHLAESKCFTGTDFFSFPLLKEEGFSIGLMTVLGRAKEKEEKITLKQKEFSFSLVFYLLHSNQQICCKENSFSFFCCCANYLSRVIKGSALYT